SAATIVSIQSPLSPDVDASAGPPPSSPVVVRGTSWASTPTSFRRSRTWPACASARSDRRVPIRRTTALPVGIDREELPEELRVRSMGVAVLLQPDDRIVEQFGRDAACERLDGGTLDGLQRGELRREALELGPDDGVAPLAERADRRGQLVAAAADRPPPDL